MLLLDKALEYCNNVINDKEICPWEVKKQCEIFLENYNINQYKDDFEFCFSESKLKVINNLLKLMNYATGFVAGKNILEGLAGFQALFLCAIFGWRYKNDINKMMYRDVVLFIPRKNAKTFITAIVFILLMLTEQNYSEFYSICIDRDLAKELRKAMAQIIGASPFIAKYFIVSESEIGIIKCKLTKSYYYPRTSKANKNNSIRPACVCVDEMGAFTTNGNIQAMRKGQLSVKNPIMVRTTTAYAESDSIMLEELDYDRAVLKGIIKNDRYFCLLYYAEREEAWTDEAIYKANPLRIEENYNEIKSDREIAKIKTKEQEEFLTKNLNIFLETNELNKYIDITYWKKCVVDNIDFSGKNVIVGIDMSVTTDLTAVSIMYKEDNIIYCMSHGFLPADSLDKRREKIDYRDYAKKGYCDLHKGMTVNYTLVEEYIRNIEEKYGCTIKMIVTDPMNAKEMVERLEVDCDVLKLKQTYTNLSPATKEFRKKVYDSQVKYLKNELLDWNMSNAITDVGKSDDEMLAKEDKNKQRIDMVAVLIFAYTELLGEDDSYNALDALDEMSKDW
ncbi:putative terminase large subunit [Clostridium pasteurianum DSM 525 = ATCC 6013]|uniref:Terminase n=1 Tax=Clostridium pasteurianum DSM 525 = ATCC 6013 TaxID=1262449 RepID=A0A0H3JAG8_CLOPA|nr:terminase TerL endonuclease subunit [Clostridium pasteurianum]AJA49538.1 putative terminase large subunit [Clostridium pasteurianum DSM 525 = ATCC 6013]AJA53526.1 putative terminase large subunit [Clostridium pasteurianum DSM 525 = ATCC 6013]AOZ76696.1 terminase [Clostridium pasteurianum DSM 525 = ATCC 6013]AOZ80493.1 terminase [Clostridium pasteurianum]ELP58944.1 phage terminase-like protein, large subunit [Clostridium pasteurianum DSM 525 = ATCC 6013]